MKKIIAVINQKGGVGKTTTSINFSYGLTREGHRVLLTDLDPQAHSTIGLGIEPETYKYAVHDVMLNKSDIHEVILKTSINNLDLVPSHIRLERAEQQLTPEMFRETRLHKALRGLDYDFVVIDCRPTLGTLTINALYACNFILVPCEMARFALDGFADLMETIENVKDNEEIEKEKFIRILLNKFDARKSITNEWVVEQLKPYKALLFETRIRQNEALNQAHIAMEPVFTFKANCPGAQDYEQLTKEFLNLCQQLETS
ncbi:MAG: ParA family protein [Deltaproteobacteria bacterium]|nr:ParA family protein [Deltaproteobacteria bacterium]